MEKFCIFCGNLPINKNREHLLPKWLIELTGQFRREGSFGPFYENETLEIKKFSFNKFVLPACYDCNREFGDIEGKVKLIIEKLLGNQALSPSNFNLLLTWFDKIRIGSALTTLYHLKNPYKTTPPFFIKDGAMTRDRMLLIFKNKQASNCLNIFGIGTNFIINFPICIGVIINNYGFINISKSFLLHKALGLPFPQIDPIYLEANESENYKVNFLKGPNIMSYPILDYHHNVACTELLQPIISPNILENNEASFFYGQSRYEHIFGSKTTLYGKIFHIDDSKIKRYPENNSNVWIPDELDLSPGTFQNLIAFHTIKIQNSFLEKGLAISSKEISEDTKILLRSILDINNSNLSKLPILQRI